MLAGQLKNFLQGVDDMKNIMIYVEKTSEMRQLLFSDIDINHDGNIVIDAEYDVPPKVVRIAKQRPKPW